MNLQTWNLSKNLHRRIFRLKILHHQFHLISTVLVGKNTKKMSENGEIYTAGKNFTLPPGLTGWTNSTSVNLNLFSVTWEMISYPPTPLWQIFPIFLGGWGDFPLASLTIPKYKSIAANLYFNVQYGVLIIVWCMFGIFNMYLLHRREWNIRYRQPAKLGHSLERRRNI